MPNLKSFHDNHQWAWDATSLNEAQACLRKYYYGMIRGLQPKNKSVHLIFGGVYASALEEYYKLRAGEAMDHEAALIEVIKQAMSETWKHETEPCVDEGCPQHGTDHVHIIRGSGAPVHFDDSKKTRPNLIRTIIWYLDQYGEESEDGLITYHLQDGKPAVELSFALELSRS